MKRPTIYIFMNKSLGMSPGKLAAQASHAMAYVPVLKSMWLKYPHRTILIMEARDQQHLENIEKYLKERRIISWSVIDEGVNETEPHVITALATMVVDKEDERIQQVFSTFKTYREKYRLMIMAED